MKYIVHPDMNLAQYAGRQVWLMGYSEDQTGILEPIEGYLMATMADDDMDVALVAFGYVEGRLEQLFPHNEMLVEEDDGTYVFIAHSKESMFEIPEVKTIAEMFSSRLADVIFARTVEGGEPEDVFFNGTRFFDDVTNNTD